MALQVARPRPVPCPGRFVVKNGSNTRAISSGGIPEPVSRTEKVTNSVVVTSRLISSGLQRNIGGA